MEIFTVKIKPLTPVWSGNENRKCEILRETGMLGSLRWWYEVLIRGLGGSACDPTRSKCDGKNHCDACELFGCTGWARKFRLEVESNTTTIPEIWIGTREKRIIRGKRKHLKRNVSGLMSNGEIVLKFIPLRKISSNEWALLNKTLEIIENYGGLGAKISQGNGVIKIVENNLSYNDRSPKRDLLKRGGNTTKSPNLNNFFFYKFRIKFKENISDLIKKKVFWTHQPDHNNFKERKNGEDLWDNWKRLWNDYRFLPIAFHIRDAIRHLEGNRDRRHAMFGIGGRSAQGSRVFVSHGYKINDTTVEARIWGYDVEESIKDEIKNELEDKLKEKLFSKEEYKESLESCTLTEEKTGKAILEELK